MKTIFSTVSTPLLTLLLALSVLSAGAADAPHWLTVLDNPMAKARAEGKLILLNFTTSGACDACR